MILVLGVRFSSVHTPTPQLLIGDQTLRGNMVNQFQILDSCGEAIALDAEKDPWRNGELKKRTNQNKELYVRWGWSVFFE